MTLSAGTKLAPTKSSQPSARAAWAKSTERATRGSSARSPSRCCPRRSHTIPNGLPGFQREAELVATLNHANIAAIYGLEKTDSITAIVLELVEGETLADVIARGPIPRDEALPIARQIAEALEAAHDKGVIHRDLKPQTSSSHLTAR